VPFGYAVYFTERDRNRVIRWDPDSGDVDVVAGEPADGDPTQRLKSPYSVCFDKDGFLLIADKHNNRIARLRGGRLETLAVRDADGHRRPMPGSPRGYTSHLYGPTGVFLEKQGSVLCTYSDDNTIYRVHPDNRLELVLGVVGNRPLNFGRGRESVPTAEIADTPIDTPTGVVARSDGTLFFIERGRYVVREYEPRKGLRCLFPASKHKEWASKADAPAQASIRDYHPALPVALALDAQEMLYIIDLKHAAVLAVDLAAGLIRCVVQTTPVRWPREMGMGGMAFGPDGTAWLIDVGKQDVRAYAPTASGPWTKLGVELGAVRGEPLRFPQGGTGVVTGK
jgi:sugar lactone lactonase YvrE